jgi:hypothetical protein
MKPAKASLVIGLLSGIWLQSEMGLMLLPEQSLAIPPMHVPAKQ